MTARGDVGSVQAGFTDPFTQHLGYRALRRSERTASAWVPVRDDLLGPDGDLRRCVVGYLVDATAGVVCGMAAVPGWVVTADLEYRMLGRPRVGPLRADAVVRRPGRRQSLGEVTVHDEGSDDLCVAVGTVNHLVIAPDGDLDVPSDMPIGVMYERATPADRAPVQLGELLGLRPIGDDAVELPIEGIAVNPLGFLHGGLIALLVEESVRRVTGAELSDAVIRFVGPVREGVARAKATLVPGVGGPVVRVDVCDRSGRIGAVVTARPEASA